MAALLFLIQACQPEPNGSGDLVPGDSPFGTLQVEFTMPTFNLLPDDKVHRAMLCVAYTPDSLDREEYLDCANVSDRILNYDFKLMPGTYYYLAAITCSAEGDSCLWGGFPGGRMGLQWTIVQVIVETGEITISRPVFQ